MWKTATFNLDPDRPMTSWNLADLLEAVAASAPERQAQVALGRHERRFTWRELDRRAEGLARSLVAEGAHRQDKVAQYLTNCPEYMESVVGCFRASLVPVNTNYRYVEAELAYLWDNADVTAVIFHGAFAERIAGLRPKLPRIRTWLWVDDQSGPRPAWAIAYEDAIADGVAAPEIPWARSGDDLWLLYTGGTTGMPKGVMWRQDDLWHLVNNGRPEPFDLAGGLDGVRAQMESLLLRRVQLPACPLMHGTGFLTALGALLNGGSVITLESPRFDPVTTLEAIRSERVQSVAIVGDAFARPLLAALDQEPGRFDVSSLEFMVSSGVMWSAEVKAGLLRHNPKMVLADGLGSSESIGMGRAESTGDTATPTARFTLGDHACVITDDGRKVEPGSDEVGRIAVTGRLPVGYYKDPGKSAATFPTIDGVRYSIAGDYATVDADGSLRLLGRGSVCINTGGEKVFPEEVEEALKQHPQVRDAVCVGLPDPRFGQMVTAVIEATAPAIGVESGPLAVELTEWVKTRLAGYKAPRRVLFRDSLERAANGKADYAALREWAARVIAASP